MIELYAVVWFVLYIYIENDEEENALVYKRKAIQITHMRHNKKQLMDKKKEYIKDREKKGGGERKRKREIQR